MILKFASDQNGRYDRKKIIKSDLIFSQAQLFELSFLADRSLPTLERKAEVTSK